LILSRLSGHIGPGRDRNMDGNARFIFPVIATGIVALIKSA
jgi:hypothetical protein